jgi:hypothetical protein
MVSCNRVDRISHAVAPTRPSHLSDHPTLAGLTKAGPQVSSTGKRRLRVFVEKDLGEITSTLKPDNNPYIALIIDLNQTPGSFDLAMIAR